MLLCFLDTLELLRHKIPPSALVGSRSSQWLVLMMYLLFVSRFWRWTLRSVFVWTLRFSQPGTWDVFLGLHTQQQIGSAVVKRSLVQVIAHPNYNSYTYDNDIALMELDSPVTYSDYIKPICLPAPTHDFPSGSNVWVTGWGATREGGESWSTVNIVILYILYG